MLYRPLVVVMLCWGLAGGPGAWAQERPGAADGRAADGRTAAGRTADGRAAASRSSLSTTTPEEYEKLVQALGDPQPRVRDVATERLCLLDKDYLPQLSRSFEEQRDFEVQRRLRYIVEYIFHRDQIAGNNGFLGVEIDGTVLRVAHDPHAEEDDQKNELGIGVKRAMDGFAARRAGLEDGDIIIGFNGRPLPHDRLSTAFVNLVSSRSPGEEVELTVLRREEPRALRVRAGERATTLLDGAMLELCTLSPKSDEYGYRRALRVLHVEPGSPAAAIGLPVRSCLYAVNDQSLDANNAENLLRTVVHSLLPDTEVTFTVAEAREVTLDVTLGTRPVEKITDLKAIQEARQRFMAFWKAHGGEFLVLQHRGLPRMNFNQFKESGQLLPEVRVLP